MPTSAADATHLDLLRPAQATAAEFRHECAALAQLADSLFAEIEQLSQQLEIQADELTDGRRRLAERGRQLAEQRKESGRLTQVLEQQEQRLGETLAELKALRQQIDDERAHARCREAEQSAAMEERLRAAEAQREQLRHELHVLQATAAANGGSGPATESLAPLINELSDLRRQLSEAQQQLHATHQQLGETRTELAVAIDRAATAAEAAAAQQHVAVAAEVQPPSPEAHAHLAELERERIELESELELVRTRATELQETVHQQKRELVDQRAELSSELRLLRELIEQLGDRWTENSGSFSESSLAVPASRAPATTEAPPADPVINSVMAQFARLQKDVAQRRKKK